MSRSVRATALALALGSSGCTVLLGGTRSPERARLTGLPEVGVRVGGLGGLDDLHQQAAEQLVCARLSGRGVTAIKVTDEPAPGRVLVSVWLRGERPTPLTRFTGLPWSLVFLGTVGLVPLRTAEELIVEVQITDLRPAAGLAVHTVRRSFERVSWAWLPLAFSASHRSLDERRSKAQAVEGEGILHALDDALDEVLATPSPAATGIRP